METIYYNLDARRLTVYGMASGEAAPAPRDMLFLRARPQTPQQEGRVLDFYACRRALTGEEAPFAAPDAVMEGAQEDHSTVEDRSASSGKGNRARRPRRLHLALDAAASLAVMVMAAVVVSQFLGLL